MINLDVLKSRAGCIIQLTSQDMRESKIQAISTQFLQTLIVLGYKNALNWAFLDIPAELKSA